MIDPFRPIGMVRAILLFLLAFPLFAGDFSYVYARPEGSATISRGSLQEMLRIRERFQGEFLWARVDGREYVIRDAVVLGDVRRAFAPLDALAPHQRALDTKMRPVEQRAERLEREADELSDAAGELTREQKRRLLEIKRALRDLERELRPLEEEERRLDAKEEELEKVFERELERLVRRSVRNGKATRLR